MANAIIFSTPKYGKENPSFATTKSTEIQKENKVKKLGTKKRDHHLASVGATEAVVPT